MCRPHGVSERWTAGFPLPSWAAPSLGTLRVAVLFVDFPNAQAFHTTHEEAELGIPAIEKYLETFSYGKLDVQLTPLHRWLRAEHTHDHYSKGSRGITAAINEEAVRLADPDFDFSGYHAVMIVMPSTHFSGGVAGARARTQEGVLVATRINAFPLQEPGKPSGWGFVGAHELMHNLGLPDLYPTESAVGQPTEEPPGKRWVRATFDNMRLWVVFPIGNNDSRLSSFHLIPNGSYTMFGSEMLAWSRWQLGWLDTAQIRCLNRIETETTVTLNPIAMASDGTAMVAIPIPDNQVIVIESRRKVGYDNGLAAGGVLVYTVNAAVETGKLPIKIAGATNHPQAQAFPHLIDHYPLLSQSQSVTVADYTITVSRATNDTDTVTITKTNSP